VVRCITGVGGGTVRDLILNLPVFWVQNPAHVSACLVTAVVMHFVAPRVESPSGHCCGSAGRFPSSASRRSANAGEALRKIYRMSSKKRRTSTAFDTRLRWQPGQSLTSGAIRPTRIDSGRRASAARIEHPRALK
jgi:hypothetical protein